MAEGLLFGIAEGILGRLGSRSLQDLGLLWGVKDELEKLQDTVSAIKAVLLDAEEKQAGDNAVKHWLERLTDVVYEADDLLDDFSTEGLLREMIIQGRSKTEQVRTFFSKSDQLAYRVKIGPKIKKIRKKLDAIRADSKFHLEPRNVKTRALSNKKRDDSHSYVFPEEVIGREDDKKAVIDLLMYSNIVENVSILSIVGIGGLGKTTLALQIFNDAKIEEHFEVKMWVCVSDNFEVQNIVEKMLESATKMKPQTTVIETLVDNLKKRIEGKKYFLVLDDLWNQDSEKWMSLEKLLVGGARGSRILVTTRSLKVARIARTAKPYFLRSLDEDASWCLFKKMAFEKGEEPENSRIVAIGEDILEKCVGVPLFITIIGRLLYSRKLEAEWLSFRTNKLLIIKQKDILSTLKRSYDKLPSHLKPCFAYCSLFPKNYTIDKSILVNLWVAQGFIKLSNQDECFEDVCNEYFMDLLWESFFLEAERDEYGDVISCKMHDFMHDLAIEVSGSSCTTFDSGNKLLDESKTRHVAIGDIDFCLAAPTLFSKASMMRTLFFHSKSGMSSLTESNLDAIFSNLKLLRTLCLQYQEIDVVPSSISKLKHLRYLDLSENISIKKLPDSITWLQNLYTLRLTNCECLKELPRDIKKLVNLRHLEIDGCDSLKYMSRGLGELTNLQTLSHFVIPSGSVPNECADLSELNRLNSLRGKLMIKIGRHGKDVALQCKAANLKEKKHLRSLQLKWTYVSDSSTEDVLVEELEGLQPHPNLKCLDIKGYRGGIFPSWLLSLTNLVELSLRHCEKLQYLPELSQLMPSLKSVYLEDLLALEYISNSGDSYDSIEMNMETLVLDPHLLLSFPRLSTLWIINCPMLTSMTTFPSVEELYLKYVSLKRLQQTIASSSTLVPSPTPLSKLKRLKLCSIGDLETLPEEWMRNLSSLEYLSIIRCDAFDVCNDEDGMQWQGLKSLLSLQFRSLPKLVSLPLGLQHVSTLQKLFINQCDNFMAIPEWIDNCTSLVELEIWECQRLTSLPEGMRGLTSLQRLCIEDCSPILLERCKRETGVDWPKISHIPHLNIKDYASASLEDEDEKSGSTTETPIPSTIESTKTPVAEATRPWNLRRRRTAFKFLISREDGKGQRFPSRRKLQIVKLTVSLSRKKIEDSRTSHCPGVLVSERTVDSHTVSKSAKNKKGCVG